MIWSKINVDLPSQTGSVFVFYIYFQYMEGKLCIQQSAVFLRQSSQIHDEAKVHAKNIISLFCIKFSHSRLSQTKCFFANILFFYAKKKLNINFDTQRLNS